MLILLCAFNLNIGLGTEHLEIIVTPEYGLYGYVIATLLSMLLLHVAHATHTYIAQKEQQVPHEPFVHEYDSNESAVALCVRRFSSGYYVTSAGVWTISLLQLTSLTLLIVGIQMNLSQFKYNGAVELVLDSQDKKMSLLEQDTWSEEC